MGIFDFLSSFGKTNSGKSRPNQYADSSTIADDEKAFYQPDEYYTLYSYPGTYMQKKVITFEERKKTTFPSTNGLYVAEIMLLEYCSYRKYPKPKSGYPGFWWFEYGIRDVGSALKGLENRGFIRFEPMYNALSALKVSDLKTILSEAGISAVGKKEDLIVKIKESIPSEQWPIHDYCPKYELTELGADELSKNGYVPYMHKHPHKTTEDDRFGDTFCVWNINKLFAGGDASQWRQIVGQIEKQRFGVDMANAIVDDTTTGPGSAKTKKEVYLAQRDDIRKFLQSKSQFIDAQIKKRGDGFEEESAGLDLLKIGKDKEALVQFYISIGKKFDAPALYRECSKMLHKYGLYEEELVVINAGLKNTAKGTKHWEYLSEKKQKVKDHIQKEKV